MFNGLYSYAHPGSLRAKKTWQSVQTGIRLAFHSGMTDDAPHNNLKPFIHRETRTMKYLCIRFYNDEAGFVVSTELVLVCTVTVLSLCVGLSEVSFGINGELEDLGSAFGSLNQSFHMQGFTNCKGSMSAGQCFVDHVDQCDNQHDIVSTQPTGEQNSNNWNN